MTSPFKKRVLVTGIAYASILFMDISTSCFAQSIYRVLPSQQYYSPQAMQQRQLNTCIMQRRITPSITNMCGGLTPCTSEQRLPNVNSPRVTTRR